MSTQEASTEDGAPSERRIHREPSVPCRSIDWYAEGETRVVEVGGVKVVVRLVGRKGRRARIAIEAPAGATFRDEGVRNA